MVTNFFPIHFNSEELHVQRVPYDDDLLKSLRDNYNSTHSFFRAEDYIYISPYCETEFSLGETITLSIAHNPKVVGSLLRHILFRAFKDAFKDIKPLSFYPLRFPSRNVKHNFINDALPYYLQSKISYKKQNEIQIRQVEIDGLNHWGIVVNTNYKWEFNISCLELIKGGFGIEGLEVIWHYSHIGLENILEPEDHLIGTINSVLDKYGYVDTNDGLKRYKLDELYLHKTKENIGKYLKFKIGDKGTEQVYNSIRKNDIFRYNAKNSLADINAIARAFSKLKYQNADGFSFSIIPNSNINVKIFNQENPTFLFSYDGYKKNTKPDIGLNNFGPYDSSTFDVKKPRVLVVCHRNHRGSFSSFLAKLTNGIPDSQYFKSGMIDKYRLQDIDFVIEEISNYSIREYLDILQKSIRLNSDNAFDLALIETKNDWKYFLPENNPYYHIKAYLLTLGIPVQLITSENTRKNDFYLGTLLNSIALQMYAKLGGTPWALPANTNVDREIIVGIGSATYRSNSFANASQSRIVGITTFFSSDGTYLFGNKCKDVSYDQYFSELLSNLNSSIKELSKRDGWIDGDTIRIVFHIFKPIKNVEADVIEELIGRHQQYHIKYAFVTISETHPFMIFDAKQEGQSSHAGIKGQYVAPRGQSVILSESSCLIQMKGPNQIKSIKQGMSRPLLVKIHEKSSFRDLYYIAQQIFSFTTLSWRSFLPAQMPVTIYYSDLIVNVLSNLRRINGWNSEVINGSLKFKKWFL